MLRNKSLIKRRQKPVVQPVYRIENETNPENASQYFQITVNVIEACKLVWTNPNSSNSYVIVVIGKKKQRTSIRRNMEEPQYRDYFIFEMYTSIYNIKRTNLWLAVMQPRCCTPSRLLGETNIELGNIWMQPNHQVVHKWAQLSIPRDPAAGVVGFLKVNISIIFKGGIHSTVPIGSEDNENEYLDLLLRSGSEQQRASYLITVYGGYGLCNPISTADRSYGKPPSTFVRVTFCGLTVKTAVQYRNHNPSFCEQVSIVEMFPNINQLIHLEVCTVDTLNKVIGGAYLNLAQISHDGNNGFLPTFGPSLLHMYGTPYHCKMATNRDDEAFHQGALLVSLKTVVPYYEHSIRTTNIEPVTLIKLENLCNSEDFCIFCPILEVSMLNRGILGKSCGIAITIGEIPSEHVGDEEFVSIMSEIRSRKLHYTGSLDVIKTPSVYGYLHFANSFPVLQLATRLPDFRFRMYRNNMICSTASHLEHTLKNVENRLKNFDYSAPNELIEEINKAVEDTAKTIFKYLNITQYSSQTNTNHDCHIKQYTTEFDQKQECVQKEEIEKIYQKISKMERSNFIVKVNESTTTNKTSAFSVIGNRKEVKLLLAETKALVQDLKSLVYNILEGWPDIVVWLLSNGSRVAFAKVSAADIIYSVTPEQSGRHCGRIQTVNMKPLKCLKQLHTPNTGCFCMVGKIELLLWMGLYRQFSAFETFLPNGYKIKVKELNMSLKAVAVMLECRFFIHGAKLMNIDGNPKSNYIFIRFNALNTVKESRAKQKTLTPIWNQVLKINKIGYTSQERIIHSPPDVFVEVFDSNLSGKTELIGKIQIQPVVDDRQDYEFAPKLQWYDLYRGLEYTGQLLMSVQLLQISETLLRTTNYGPVEAICCASEIESHDVDNAESVPDNLIPQLTTYKLDIYWWGLRDVITRKPGVVLEIEELIVKSDIIVDNKPSSNFAIRRTTQTYNAPLNTAYSPPLTVRLYDHSTFGRTLFLGTNVVKNPNKYTVHWCSRNERDIALKSASIRSVSDYQVTPFPRVYNDIIYNEMKKGSNNESNTDVIQSKAKRSSLKKLFWRRELDEEEYALLPVFNKENNLITSKQVRNSTKKYNDVNWWTRYFSSLKDNDEGYIVIDKMTIYNTELESQPNFSKFKDWCATIKLYNGKKTGIPEKDEQLNCGCLKVGIAIYKWPPPENMVAVSTSGIDLSQGYFSEHPSNNDYDRYLVRVYIVKGVNLKTKDFTGKLNPYCVIGCGNKSLGDRNSYISNTVNPIFGEMYEFRCTLPEDYLLTVSIYDYDSMAVDDLIGSTSIDLENRIYTKHKARVGLPFRYTTVGSGKWRDYMKPSEILETLCSLNHIPPPYYPNINTVVFNEIEYKYNERHASDMKENMCLSLLHKWHTLPICGYHLVPEHVETRSLYNYEKSRLEQGKLQMWVDIFPLDNELYIPLPVDITPRKMEDYELRVIIWDVHVPRLGDDTLCGKEHADIYVKAWIGNNKEAQYTDVHRQTKSGVSSFNWRMIFHFQYQHTSGKLHVLIFLNYHKLVKKEKGPFIEHEELVSPTLVLQVLKSDADSNDEFVASVAFNLNAMSQGTVSGRTYQLKNGRTKKTSLFTTRSVRAWWPLVTSDIETGLSTNAGMVDLEMNLLPSEKAILLPVGLGRDPPSPLPEPRRLDFKGANDFSLLESLFRHGGLEYLIVAIILFITFIILLCLYLDIPKTVFDYIINSYFS